MNEDEKTKDVLVVNGPVDAENNIEGGYCYVYNVVSCNVSPEKGALTFDRVRFPEVPALSNVRSSDIGVTISREDPKTIHVSQMSCVTDDVIDALRDEGVNVIVQNNPSPMFSIDL